MARRPVPIKVKSKDLKTIGQLIKHGIHQARVFMRALALRQLGQGITAPQVAAALPLTPKAIREIAHRYNSNGFGSRALRQTASWGQASSRRFPKATYRCHGLQ